MPPQDSDEQADGAPAQWDKPPRRQTKSSPRRKLLIAAVVAALALAGSWEFGLWSPPERVQTSESIGGSADDKTTSSGISLFPAGKRAKAPTLEGELVEGGTLQAESMRGKVVVVNIWGSWCAPCRAEAPDLARVARETEPKGVTFLGIDVRDDKASAQAFTRRYAIPYQSLFDPNGSQLVKFSSIIPINAVPSTVVVDRSGRVAARVVGRVSYKTLNGLVQDVLAESPSSSSR